MSGNCEDGQADEFQKKSNKERDAYRHLLPCECVLKQGVRLGSRSPRLLPPIHGEIEDNPGCLPRLTKSPLTKTKCWSRYHKECSGKETHLFDFYVGKCDKKQKRLAEQSPKIDDESTVTRYLDQNKDFLETYVMENIPVNELQKWLVMKTTREHEGNKMGHKDISRESKSTVLKKYELMELIQNIGENANELSITWYIAGSICSTIGYDAYRVYKIFPDHPNFVQYFVTETTEDLKMPSRMLKANPDDISLVLEVAESTTCLRVSRNNTKHFPDLPQSLLESFEKLVSEQANHVMYIPILTIDGKTAYVIEIFKFREEFNAKDEELGSNFIVWASLTLHYCMSYLDKTKERSMTDFLLDVVKAIFEEMVSLDQLIKRILEFAQKLVDADRSSLFLVDYSKFELVSTVFDLKFEPGHGRDMERKEIRMPINRGIAGHVALSGETMNIPDAYSDYRFNREVDEATGYKTLSILCMPVKVQGKVIGVVQMVNKRNHDNFDHEDEVAFEIFSTFFGLALHHARLYDKIMRNEQKYRVALEVLSYHNTCREHEVEEILKNETYVGNVKDFYLDPYELDDFQKCKAVITMFDDLFEVSRFNVLSLTRFILTVKKNYRSVPYHNFDHGWSVAQAMYAIIKHDTKKRFDYKMRLALFVACLCHDLDHRGYTNKYLNEIASPLAAMYTTSPLEHHHFNITVNILQQDGHNIFSHLSSEDYKDILRYIRHCILATDLAAFFPNLGKLKDMFFNEGRRNKFNWLNPSHRDLAMAISMTSADLSAAAKPWEIQIKTVKVIFEEFYDQGDKERAAGKIPIPMMDRCKPEEQPASQVGFLSQICIPCYKMLCKMIPKTKPMYKMVLKNLNIWKSKAVETTTDTDNIISTKGDISDITSESDEDNDDLDNQLALLESNTLDIAENNSNEDKGGEFKDDEDDDDDIKKINSEIKLSWKYIKSDSVSWEEEQGVNENVATKTEKIWTGIGNTWIDSEGVVIRSNKVLKKRNKGTESDMSNV